MICPRGRAALSAEAADGVPDPPGALLADRQIRFRQRRQRRADAAAAEPAVDLQDFLRSGVHIAVG